MRIDGNARVGAAAARRAGRTSAGGGAFSASIESETPTATTSVSATGVVEGLLAFQEVEDPTSGLRRRAWQRASDLLDRLDELKIGILSGAISSERLAQLAHLARSGRGASGIPALDEVLGEIELRAAVELAKLQRRDAGSTDGKA